MFYYNAFKFNIIYLLSKLSDTRTLEPNLECNSATARSYIVSNYTGHKLWMLGAGTPTIGRTPVGVELGGIASQQIVTAPQEEPIVAGRLEITIHR